jgi:SAM-dependent methyltransferase
VDWQGLQREWDAQQETYMRDREHRFAAMLDVLEAAVGTRPRIVDLAGGTGSITARLLCRFPDASSTIVDIDDALLTIAAGTFADDQRVRVLAADLDEPAWARRVSAPASVDAVLTATALHWLSPRRVAGVYAEARELLRPGGLMANADHMADDGLPGLSPELSDFAERRRLASLEAGGATDWQGWWERLRCEPELADAVAARDARFARRDAAHTESTVSAAWHVRALRDAGYAEAGLVWRGLTDAVVVGRR